MSEEIQVSGSGNLKELIKMLAYIELCGNIGHTPKYLKVYIDGDGNTRFNFKFKNENTQMYYDKCKKMLLNKFNKNGKDLEFVDL